MSQFAGAKVVLAKGAEHPERSSQPEGQSWDECRRCGGKAMVAGNNLFTGQVDAWSTMPVRLYGGLMKPGSFAIRLCMAPESALEQTQRHVREGAERIAKQEALIEELARDGHDAMLPDAREFLDQLKTIQALGVEHLAREQESAQHA